MFQPSENRKKEVFDEISERLCFIGHTHTLEIIGYDGLTIEHNDLPEGLTSLVTNKRYIINIGSVGQPRDTSNDAKYVIWDSVKDSVEVRYVPYDIGAVVKKIKAAGLPEEHGRRLW